MKIAQFLSIIQTLSTVKWSLGSKYGGRNCVRTIINGKQMCPLELVCYYQGGTFSWNGGRIRQPLPLSLFWQFGQQLGLAVVDYHHIMQVSDNDLPDDPLRNDLLAACYI